jgi:hypothetical protein
VVVNAAQQYLQEEAIYGGYETAARYVEGRIERSV